MNYYKAFVCVFYGIISILQTLNSRFLFRNLEFRFYSAVTSQPPRSSWSRESSSCTSTIA